MPFKLLGVVWKLSANYEYQRIFITFQAVFPFYNTNVYIPKLNAT